MFVAQDQHLSLRPSELQSGKPIPQAECASLEPSSQQVMEATAHSIAKVVKLIPPEITDTTIDEEIVCTRPMRDGKFNISLESVDGQIRVHCYGHGGSGWTTLFGSVKKAIGLFEKADKDKDVLIRVIGSGCMGLTMAIELKILGHDVSISTKSKYDIASWRAAGYFALVSVKTSPEEQDDLNEIGINTFLTYKEIESGTHPYISKEAVRFMPVYCSEGTEAGVEDLEARGLIPARERVTLDFGNGVTHSNFFEYKTYFMNTTTLMRQLIEKAAELKIPIEEKEIAAFSDIEESVVINCSGLGSYELNNDQAMIPVRGHLVTLNKNAGSAHMDYMIYTKVLQKGKEKYIYLFPKDVSITPGSPEGTHCKGVLGGTFMANAEAREVSKPELNKRQFKKMLDRNCEFYHGHPYRA